MWTKLPNEPANSYARFNLYCMMPYEHGVPRSYAKVAEIAGVTERAVAMMGSKYKWVERADAYDAHMRQMKQEQIEEQVLDAHKEATARWLATSQFVQGKLIDFLQQGMNIDKLDVYSFARLWELAVKIEGQALGKPDVSVGLTETKPIDPAIIAQAQEEVEKWAKRLLPPNTNSPK